MRARRSSDLVRANVPRTGLDIKAIDVLLVDASDPDVRLTCAAVRCAAPNASMVRVKDGEQALRLMLHKGLFTERPQLPRLILLELNLPRTSGHAVLDRLRCDTAARSIPVIVLTTTECRSALSASYALGARACCVKPNEPIAYASEVVRIVQRYL